MTTLDTTSPFEHRPLTRAERRRRDLYLFKSPKLGRRVDVIGPLALAVALQFDFDVNVLVYVERPRLLPVQGSSLELHFWTRERRGRERFWLIVPTDETIDGSTPRRAHRHAQALIEAARSANIALEFVFEDVLRKRSAQIGTEFRLLPYVQTARALPNRAALRQQVLGVFEGLDRATVDQVQSALHGFNPDDTMAVVADLIHAGDLVLSDPRELGRFSVIERGGRHDHA